MCQCVYAGWTRTIKSVCAVCMLRWSCYYHYNNNNAWYRWRRWVIDHNWICLNTKQLNMQNTKNEFFMSSRPYVICWINFPKICWVHLLRCLLYIRSSYSSEKVYFTQVRNVCMFLPSVDIIINVSSQQKKHTLNVVM